MNWDAIGAIGEVIGAVVVFFTLLFLILQIRQNTLALNRETGRANLEQGSSWIYALVKDPEIANLYLRGLQGELSTTDDKLRFHLLLQVLFNQWALAFNSGSRGVSKADVEYVLATPGGMKYWRGAFEKNLHSEVSNTEFADWVNSISRDQA